jgi:hypothetical protein
LSAQPSADFQPCRDLLLYVLHNYVPDGKGLTNNGRPLRPGDEITVNDGLVLYLTKALP